VHYNSEKNRGENKGILVIITTKIVGEMLQLSIAGIHAPPTMQKDKAHKFCLKFIDQEFWNEKEDWQVFGFQGRCLFKVLALMQALWLRGTRATYRFALVGFSRAEPPDQLG